MQNLVSLLQGASGQHGVEYRFWTAGAPSARWRVRRAELSESLSRNFHLKLELSSTHGDDSSVLLGQPCTLSLLRHDAERYFQGLVTRVSRGELLRDVEVIEIEVVPGFEALAHRLDTRIFQDKTIPEVLDLVIGPALAPYGRKHRPELQRTVYPKREYIVQYRESDLAFVRRLMAEEGIWYRFEHPSGEGEPEVVVLCDANDNAPDAELGPAGKKLSLALSRAGSKDREAATRFVRADLFGSTSLTVRAYDWTTPPVAQQKVLPSEELGDRPKYEPNDLTFWEYGNPKYGKFDTNDQARLRWEQDQASDVRATGVSNVIGLCPGQVIEVEGHPTGLNGEWVVVSVQGKGHYLQEDAKNPEGVDDYSNTFTCIPKDVPYRPKRETKPRVHGIQTALVVGADGKPEIPSNGDDIHTDEHGRIQVKPSWDRTDPATPEGTETCWLRVAQQWGGQGWGFMFIPRIGMEVIVSFIDGDPDRPLITGCVYNGLNRPHYELPAEKTKSYIMTQSTPNGDGSNELRFDDAKGNEEIYVHAEKDYNEVVENNHSTTVHANQTNTVDKNQTETVTGNQTMTVTGKRTKTVGGDKENGESNTIHGERDTTVTKKNTETYQDEFEITVTKATTETMNDTRTTKVKADDYYRVTDGNKTIEVETGSFMTLAKKALSLWQSQTNGISFENNAHMQTDGELTITNGKTGVKGDKGGELVVNADSAVRLVCGKSKVELKSDGSITLTGVKIAIGVPNNTVNLEAAGVTTSGTKVSTTAIGIHEIQGAMIKIG